jgi:hypothetical protein
LLFAAFVEVALRMRESNTVSATEKGASSPVGTPAQLVCLALLLAIAALACRIASLW